MLRFAKVLEPDREGPGYHPLGWGLLAYYHPVKFTPKKAFTAGGRQALQGFGGEAHQGAQTKEGQKTCVKQ